MLETDLCPVPEQEMQLQVIKYTHGTGNCSTSPLCFHRSRIKPHPGFNDMVQAQSLITFFCYFKEKFEFFLDLKKISIRFDLLQQTDICMCICMLCCCTDNWPILAALSFFGYSVGNKSKLVSRDHMNDHIVLPVNIHNC